MHRLAPSHQIPPNPTYSRLCNIICLLSAKGAGAKGGTDFTPLWSGQAGALARALPAGELVRLLAQETQDRLKALAG